MEPHQDPTLDALIKAKATRYEAPPELRAHLVKAVQQSARLSDASHGVSRWSAWREWLRPSLAFACGLLVSVALLRVFPQVDEQEHLVQDLVAGHVRSLMVAHLSDVVSSDQHTVKPWFTGKLDFSPPVSDLAREGFPLVGGRLDYMEQRAVAALVYQHRLHTINLFVWPASSSSGAATRAKMPAPRQGFNLVHWTASGLQFWAVSDISPEDLQIFAALLRR